MSRKAFIESHGATCRNWNWSWSFVNPDRRQIIFGAWDDHLAHGRGLIFSNTWERNVNGRRQNGWTQSREHIRLVEEENYELSVYRMFCANVDEAEIGIGPRKIKRIDEELIPASLHREADDWYATINQP